MIPATFTTLPDLCPPGSGGSPQTWHTPPAESTATIRRSATWPSPTSGPLARGRPLLLLVRLVTRPAGRCYCGRSDPMTEPTGANRIYESACHEGDRALARILEAARALEAER